MPVSALTISTQILPLHVCMVMLRPTLCSATAHFIAKVQALYVSILLWTKRSSLDGV